MKFYTSYFYQIRFMPPYVIPLSTAVWPPKWYNNFKGKGHQFVDKRGVINGISITPFEPGEACEGLCYGSDKCTTKDPNTCKFLQTYYKQLSELNFLEIMKRFDTLGTQVKNYLGFEEEPEFALIFCETPTNPCSERWAVQKWFKENGVEIKEWNKNEGK